MYNIFIDHQNVFFVPPNTGRPWMKIKVIIGEEKLNQEIPEEYTVKDLLKRMEIPSETVVVKKNEFIIIEEELIQEGDTIEIIKVIYGG
jgi:sulfur carrier protein